MTVSLLTPCKLSFSEPQRTLLSVELRNLSFFQYACHYVPFRHFMPFFQTFSCVFLRCLPAMSSFSQRCPQVSLAFPSLPFIFSSIVIVFQHVPLFSSIRNSSPRLPQHHPPSTCKPSGSEPQRTLLLNCKLSCSEPQRMLLSVELRSLTSPDP